MVCRSAPGKAVLQKARCSENARSSSYHGTSAMKSFRQIFETVSTAKRKALFMLLIPLVLVMLCLIDCCAPRYEATNRGRDGNGVAVRFVYTNGGASTVCVSGDFNNWSEQKNCLSRSGDTWSTSVSLKPGRYQYLFLVDGSDWCKDPGNVLSEESGFGTNNSVLIVEW